MKNTFQTTQKKEYSKPQTERIELDNDISLVLDSTSPPDGPGEVTGALAPEYFKNDPFKTNQA